MPLKADHHPLFGYSNKSCSIINARRPRKTREANVNHPISTKNSTSEPVQSVHPFRLQRRTEITNASVFHLAKDRYPMSNKGFTKMVHLLDKRSSPFMQLFWIILHRMQNGEERVVSQLWNTSLQVWLRSTNSQVQGIE